MDFDETCKRLGFKVKMIKMGYNDYDLKLTDKEILGLIGLLERAAEFMALTFEDDYESLIEDCPYALLADLRAAGLLRDGEGGA